MNPRTVACQASLSIGFSRQEYWSRLPFPTPEDLPDPGIKPASLESPALAGRFFTTSASWEAPCVHAKSLQSCPTLCHPMECSPPGSSVHGISQVAQLVKNPPANAGDARESGSVPGLGRSWSRKWEPTPVFLPGKFHGQRSLAGYSP